MIAHAVSLKACLAVIHSAFARQDAPPDLERDLLDLAEEIEQPKPRLAQIARDAARSIKESGGLKALEESYVRMFVNARGGVPAPLYQSCHQGPERMMMGPAARDMVRRMKRAGLAQAPGFNEPPDHLAIQAAYLHRMLSLSLDGDEKALEEARDFAKNVMRPWIDVLARILDREGDHPLWPNLMGLLSMTLDEVAKLEY